MESAGRGLQEEFTEDEITMLVLFFIFFAFFVIVLAVTLSSMIKIVRQAEVQVIERFGKYHRTLTPGLHFLIPFVDVPRKVNWRYVDSRYGSSETYVRSVVTSRIDMREHVIDFGRQACITSDTVQISVDALVYFQISDPRLAVFNIQNLPDAIELLTQSTLRNIIANLSLDDTFSSREQINDQLLSTIVRDAERWGVTITRVEVKHIIPPQDIKTTMEAQIIAERERRSMVLRADGDRESSIVRSQGDAAKLVLQAEGIRTSVVNRAKGEADAKLMVAKAEGGAVRRLREETAVHGVKATEYMVAIQYLNALKDLAKGAATTAVLIPARTMDMMGALMQYNGRQR